MLIARLFRRPLLFLLAMFSVASFCGLAAADQTDGVELYEGRSVIGRPSAQSDLVRFERVAGPEDAAASDGQVYDLKVEQSFEKAWTLQTTHWSGDNVSGDNVFGDNDSGDNAPSRPAIKAGDVLLLSVWLRSIDFEGEKARVNIAMTGADEESKMTVFSRRFQFATDGEWRQYHLATTARLSVQTVRLAFHFATQPQHLQFGRFSLKNFGPNYPTDQLPGSGATYGGRQPDAAWRSAAADRITRLRTGRLPVKVLDRDGRPINDASVHAKLHRHRFAFGSAIETILLGLDEDDYPAWKHRHGPFSYDDALRYRNIVDRYFRRVTPTGATRPHAWDLIRDPENSPNPKFNRLWARSFDGTVDFCRQREIELRGHYLSWGAIDHTPQKEFADSAEQHREYQLDVLRTLPVEIGNRVDQWDVLNHPCGWGRTIEQLHGGLGFHVEIMKTARQTTPPDVQLWANEGNIISDRSQIPWYKRILEYLNQHDATPDGIGFMAHFTESSLTDMEDCKRIFDDFGTLAPRLQITELDISVGGDDELHADYLRDFMTMAFSHPQMDGIVMWGFWAGAHWKPETALWREDWSIKPAGKAYVELLTKTWHTDEEVATNGDGLAEIPTAFFGDYRITVRCPDGRHHIASLKHDPASDVHTIQLD